ncbi:VOC family protein [Cytobacillus sp. S13-E01]|uniref:SMU1112c/YaeR family gloxylase I-like metalloprotein n=1 Tax=Cytobacillus sp. S13-E01 TaxID=3031326 RepID=UPI0023D82A81|nr:VOC family protein [Cytobacillus sp. S13-E01]MDF0728257.1 VOC family protein [Cytobacillus sp. S13-E01]
MNIEGVHHIAIICSDYETSKHFYTEILGFKIIEETYRAERNSYKLDLQVPGGIQIELFTFPYAPIRPSCPEAQGLRHLAFKVKNVEEAVKKLEEQGIKVEPIRIDELTGKKFTFFSDPDGLPLELYKS